MVLFAACFAAGAARPSFADPVRADVSLTDAKGYARLLLQFSEEMPTEVVTAGSILVVKFARPVDLSVDQLSDAAPAYLGTARRDPDGTAIRIALAQQVRVNVMTAGEKVFVDLLPASWNALPPPLPAEVVRELSERAMAAERALRLQKQAEDIKKKPPVRVRASVQPTFVRLVFELPDGVGVSSSFNNDKYAMSFSQGLTFDLADAKVVNPASIKSITQKVDGDSSAVEIALIGGADVRSFRDEKNYIVDIAIDDSQNPPLKPVAAAPSSQPAARDEPLPAKAEAAPEKSAPLKSAENVKSPANPEQALPMSAPRPAAAEPAAPAIKPVMAANEVRAEPAKPAEPRLAPLPNPVPLIAPAPSLSRNPVDSVMAVRSTDDFRITFPFNASVTSALFRRSDTIWLVVANTAPLDLSAIVREGGSIVAEATSLPMQGGQAIRLKLARPQIASLGGDDRALTVTLADKAVSPQPLTALRNIAEPGRANVSITLVKPGPMLRFADPDAGDTLAVVTAPLPARGFIRRQNFVEFTLLESEHGVVIQPNSDDVTADIAPDKIVLTRPGGLTLSASNASAEKSATSSGPVFDVNEWRENQKAPFFERQNEIIKNASIPGSDDGLQAHLAGARFYLARGFYPEAKGLLDLMLVKPRTEDAAAPLYILHSVASALAGRPELALKDLDNPLVAGSADSQIWKSFALARLGKWAEAREKFKNVEYAMISLPVDLQRLLLIEAMRAALEVRDYSGATARSNDLQTIGIPPKHQPMLALLRGRLAEALGHEQEALANYHEAAGSSDRPIAAQARLAEVTLRQKRGEANDDQTLTDLETLSMTWRGDATEAKNLQMLVHLYGSTNRYSEAFAAAFNIARIQPDSETARAAMEESSALFAQIYLTPKGDDLPPVEALAMFYEYRALTPIGRRGDEMIRRLADRLVAVDLLDQAGELLQYQIDHRLDGAARAQVASRLAMVYLMGRKPERAIAALRATRIADLAGELRQQRLLLEGRAQCDIGRPDLALDIIANLNGREAVRLRSDIYWAARRWRESAEQIEMLYGERWRDFQPLTDIEKADIIRAAIGYALAGDTVGIARFKEKYGPKMDSDGDRSAFAIASKPADGNSADFARIAKMAASIDTLDGFLREMKARYPDAVSSAKLPPEIRPDTSTTGSLPEIVGVRQVVPAR
ncbi:MAG: tetratricopeptide repeat protein [Bradyrhizobiaceae bacterium]|nr:MAG: tetratricopeptide repeat protein [Bradyrhizobiaceae bacterium]